ncbi:Proline--tRNA ligase [subsurface metagenome]
MEPSRLIKSLVYATRDGFTFVLVRGDHQVDTGKLEAALGECRPAEPEEVSDFTGSNIGFVSPVGLDNVTVIADAILEGTSDLVAGANENDCHITGVDMERDIKEARYVPLKAVEPGEPCVNCMKPLEVTRGIEVGHIFKLGTRYSDVLGANFLDEDGTAKPIIMGSYGIGVERIMASAIERYFDGDAMVWPRQIAPFIVEVLPLNTTNEQVSKVAEDLYTSLHSKGISVMIDDRDERAGVKFKDADLFGAPIQVIIGERGLKEGIAELRIRDRDTTEKVSIEHLTESVLKAAAG